MTLLPPGFFPRFFPAVIGIGRPASLLVAGRGKGSIGTVVVENTFHAGIIFPEQAVFLPQMLVFFLQGGDFLLHLESFFLMRFFHGIQACHDFCQLVIQSFSVIKSGAQSGTPPSIP